GCISLEDSRSIILKPPKSSLGQWSEKTSEQMIQKFTFSQVNELSSNAFKLFTTDGYKDASDSLEEASKDCLNKIKVLTSFLLMSQVFGPETTREEFFEGSVKQPVQDFLEGCNRLVFTYGVTNAGKTYTFQGVSRNVFSSS
ncbi:hypothetical protein ASZ78_006134, partial [Callipepla squamata]